MWWFVMRWYFMRGCDVIACVWLSLAMKQSILAFLAFLRGTYYCIRGRGVTWIHPSLNGYVRGTYY